MGWRPRRLKNTPALGAGIAYIVLAAACFATTDAPVERPAGERAARQQRAGELRAEKTGAAGDEQIHRLDLSARRPGCMRPSYEVAARPI